MRCPCVVDPREVTCLRCLRRKICPACGVVSCRPARTVRARLLGHGKRAKEKQLVFYCCPAETAAKIIQVEFRLLRIAGVVHPAIRIQCGIPVVFEKSPVERVASPPSHEINLEIRLSKPRVRVKLVGLDRHLLHVFNARLDKRLGGAAEFHSAGCRDYPVNVIPSGGQRHPIPGRVAPVTNGARYEPGQLRDVASYYWQFFNLSQINLASDGV